MSEEQLFDPSKHIGVHKETGLPLVRSKQKFKKPKTVNADGRKSEKVGFRPIFCPVKDPDTNERCSKMMTVWDDISYNRFGMCEDCFKKYNPHLFDDEMKEFVDKDGNLLFRNFLEKKNED